MNSIESIKPSVKILNKYKVPFALLHCTNLYPTPEKLIRLQAITTLKKNFPDAVVGLSDHSKTIYPALSSIALGARIIEKHFIDNKKRSGADISASMDIKQFKELQEAIQIVYASRGSDKKPAYEEKDTINFAFASVVAKKDIENNSKIKKSDLTMKRPFGGDFSAKDFKKLIGKITKRKIIAGDRLKRSDIK